MGRAFCMAYAQQLRAAAPLHSGGRSRSPPGPPPLLCPPAGEPAAWKEGGGAPHVIQRTCWAKRLLGKTRHNDPLVSQAMELTSRALPLESSECTKSLAGSSEVCSLPQNLPFDLWSPTGGSTSSEDNNSPTDLNSCQQMIEKPSMSKNLDAVQRTSLDNSFAGDFLQLSSAGYLGEVSSLKCAPATSVSKFNKKSQDGSFQKNSLDSKNLPPASSDEDKVFNLPAECSSKRSSRASCDQSTSSSDVANLSFTSDISSCKSKRTSHSSNSSITPPPPPERHDSLTIAISEESELRDAPWFQAGIPREIALEILEQEPVGSFMVRESTSKPGCFALSLRVPRDFHLTGIAHYLILQTNRGYKIKGFTKEFGTLTALITHHSVMPELLPCPLSLSKYYPTFRKSDSEDMLDVDEDADYNLMSDFRKVLADINV